MFLRALPRVLTWEEPSEELSILHDRYMVLLAGRLGQLLSRLPAASSRTLVDELKVLMQRLDYEDLAATLAAPEVSYRLLWPRHHQDTEAAEFILGALRTACAAAGGAPVAAPAWLANGSASIDASGSLTRPWAIACGLPVDCGSPCALLADVSGERVRSPAPAQPLTFHQQRSTLVLLESAMAETARCVPHAWAMAREFTKALILLPDRQAPEQFSSGSSGQFVGRSVLSNPHLAKVTRVQLAEGVVHEAIHAVLYMDEQHDPWVLDPALYAGPMRIASPWTGNRLPLRPFLQASFVWYGILAFWAQALPGGGFPEQQVRERLNESAAGFLRVDLLDEVAGVADRLAPELLDAVANLQYRVRTVLQLAEAA